MGKSSVPNDVATNIRPNRKNYAAPIIIIFILVSVMVALGGPFFSRKSSVKIAAPVPVATAAARGVVEGGEEIELSGRKIGRISAVYCEEGDSVHLGQLLVKLENSVELAQLDQTKANLKRATFRWQQLKAGYRGEDVLASQNALARAIAVFEEARDEHSRQQRLFAKDATSLVELNKATERMRVSEESMNEARAAANKMQKGERPEEVEQARMLVEAAQADLNRSFAELQKMDVVSPLNGVVAAKLKHPGENVDIGTPVLVLIDPSKMRIRAELEETDVGKVRQGQHVKVTSDSLPDKVFTGIVTKIFSVVRKKTQKNFDPMVAFDINTQKIYISLNDWSGLYHGMTVRIQFEK